MAYGNFKSLGRAARRGHVAEWKGTFSTVLLRPVKSQKGGLITRNGETILNRHWKGAYWPIFGALKEAMKVDDRQKLTHL